MKKILHIIYGFHNGGVEKVLLHYIDTENYDVTIMYLNPSDDKCIGKFQNIKIVKSPYNLTHKYKFYRYLSTYLKKNHFDVIHTHLNKYNYIPLKCAYKNHIDVRISHCHGIDNVTANIIKKFYRIFFKNGVEKYATIKVSCSKSAGQDLYKGKFRIIYNPIDLKTYQFDVVKREVVREKYGIKKEQVVLGTVGRFSYLKNHYFLFQLLNRLDDKYILMMVGDGELREDYQKYLKEHKLEHRVIFTGVIDDITPYLSAMDIFLFPSITEGFGISLIESQANGLYTLASSTLPRETKISDKIVYLPIDCEKVWLNTIKKKKAIRETQKFSNNPFNVDHNRKLFNQLYQ